MLLGTNPSNRENTTLTFKPDGTFVYHDSSAQNYLEITARFPAPLTEAEAKKALREYISEFNAQRKQVNAGSNNPIPDLFQGLKLMSAVPVMDDGRITTWNLTMAPTVRPSRNESEAPVLNGVVIATIGAGNRLMKLDFDWLPIESSELVPRFKSAITDQKGVSLPCEVVYFREPDKNLTAPYLAVEQLKKKDDAAAV